MLDNRGRCKNILLLLQSFIMISQRIDLDSPRWDQSTFMGRLRHFFWVTDYRTAIVPESKLEEAKDLLQKYK